MCESFYFVTLKAILKIINFYSKFFNPLSVKELNLAKNQILLFMKYIWFTFFCCNIFLSIGQIDELESQKQNLDTLFFVNPEEALKVSELQLPFAYESKDTFFITYFLDQAGELNRMAGNYDRAIQLLNRCLDYKVNWKDLKDLSLTHNNLGKTYGQKGMYELAINHFLEALKLMEKSGNLLGQSFYLNNLGAMYDLQKNYQMSLDYYKKALDIKTKLENEYAIAASLTNLGITYYNLGDLDEALSHHKRAYEIYKKGDRPEKWIRTINNIGEIFIAKKESNRAKEYFEEAMSYDSLITDQKLRISISSNYGHTLILLKEFEKAKKYLNQAEKMAIEAQSFSSLSQINSLKSDLFKALGEKHADLDLLLNSLDYLNRSISYNDSMINKENIRSIAEMQAKYEYEKNKRLINESKLSIAEKEKKIQKNKADIFLWSGVSLLLLLVVIITFLLYFFKQRKNLLMKGQLNLIESQKVSLEQLNEKVKTQLDKTMISLHEKEELLENVFSKSRDKKLPSELLSLSKREMEVLSYLALGWSDDMLAEKLFVSKSTIKTHLRRVYSKLLVKGRAEAVAIAHKYNLIGEYN